MRKLIKSDTGKQRLVNILLLTAAIGCVGLVFVALARLGIGIPCLFHLITKLKCPGCGNSRAAIALLRLDIFGAFSYNLLFPLEFSYIIWVYVRCCVRYVKESSFSYKTPHIALDICVLAAVLVWAVLRNIIGI
ncbi:MAG: DUF2752 domain-containing protein [Eubacteriales bacterium]|nr:DUF2752 domain-containing protein [Eubacteriales bacterium]